MVRFLTCGHVDDGKSTLIGRLLYDLHVVPNDQIIEAQDQDGNIDYSLFTDGLADERRQGITIDVAYRYFRYQGNCYRIADTPGHLEYTRNMSVAAIGSDAAVIVIDVENGIQMQSVQYAKIARFFGVRTFLVAVNKMDKVHYQETLFNNIKQQYLTEFVNDDNNCEMHFIPVSALKGDNVISISENMTWYRGSSLFSYLQNIKPLLDSNMATCLQVQNVARDENKNRWYMGTLRGAALNISDKLLVNGGTKSISVTNICYSGHPVEQAIPEQAISIQVDDNLDITRGDILVSPNYHIATVSSFDAEILWIKKLDNIQGEVKPIVKGIIKLGCKESLIEIEVDNSGLGILKTARAYLASPMTVDLYNRNKHSGLFIVIDNYKKYIIMVGTIMHF